MFAFDIHLAYHYVEINEPHAEFLGFTWTVNGCITLLKFIVLPFGLSTACYLFTKLTRLALKKKKKKKWRSEGKQVIMYLDGLGIEQVDELCKAVLSQVKCDLINSGFVPKVEQSLWKPTKRLIWLGTLSIVKQDFIKFLIRELTRL